MLLCMNFHMELVNALFITSCIDHAFVNEMTHKWKEGYLGHTFVKVAKVY